MRDGTASQTAQMVAAYRARATRKPEPVCSDPWANGFAGALGFERSIEFDKHFAHMELWIALRTAYLDLQVQGAIERGAEQVIILGAGFDTRAARLARAGVRFFEVDHPDTQAEKRTRAAIIAGYPVDSATLVACNFERDDFMVRLEQAGFDRSAAAVVIWEGVTPYLTEQAVVATASRLAESLTADSLLVFDYVSKRMAEGQGLRPRDEGARGAVSEMGEPIRWGTNDPLPLLYGCGYRYVRTVAFDQICASMTGSYERDREFRFQSICLASALPVALPVGS